MVTDMVIHGLGGADIPLTAMRVALGAFFAISGANKLRDPTNLLATFKADHIPFIRFNRWWVPGVELSAGVALIIGLLVPAASLGLLAICIVATCTDGVKRFQDNTWYDWLDDLLYLPEVLYALMLGVFLSYGAGPWSLDAML